MYTLVTGPVLDSRSCCKRVSPATPPHLPRRPPESLNYPQSGQPPSYCLMVIMWEYLSDVRISKNITLITGAYYVFVLCQLDLSNINNVSFIIKSITY